jgi:hypothetical protein
MFTRPRSVLGAVILELELLPIVALCLETAFDFRKWVALVCFLTVVVYVLETNSK